MATRWRLALLALALGAAALFVIPPPARLPLRYPAQCARAAAPSPPHMRKDAEFDVIVFGATGFTVCLAVFCVELETLTQSLKLKHVKVSSSTQKTPTASLAYLSRLHTCSLARALSLSFPSPSLIPAAGRILCRGT